MMERCCVNVYDNRSFRGHRCTKKANIKRDEKWYCSIHDPVKVQERDAERQNKWDAESRQRQEKWNRELAIHNFCKDVGTETIETLVANGETLAKWLEEKE